MTFDEIDFDKAVWTVPANRMKTGEVHEVPLSDAALAILRAQESRRLRTRTCSPVGRCGRCRTWLWPC